MDHDQITFQLKQLNRTLRRQRPAPGILTLTLSIFLGVYVLPMIASVTILFLLMTTCTAGMAEALEKMEQRYKEDNVPREEDPTLWNWERDESPLMPSDPPLEYNTPHSGPESDHD